MNINNFYQKLITLPKEAQKAASRALLYASFAMHSTEKQVFGGYSTDGSDTGAAETIGAHTLLGQIKGGVHTNQTKEFEEKYLRIMDNTPLVQITYKPILNKKGDVVAMEVIPQRGQELTKEQLSNKFLLEWESKTDKSDDYPIEYGVKIKRILINEEELVDNPKAKKEFISNFYIEYAISATGDDFNYEYPLEEVCDAVQVKTLNDNTKLVELYTNLSKYAEAYYYYKSQPFLDKLKQDITHITLLQRTHREDEIFLYKVSSMREVKEIGGKILIKFEATLVAA